MASSNNNAGSSKDGETVIPVSELRSTISTMLKEALKKHKVHRERKYDDNRKGRVARLSLGQLSH